MSWVLEKGDCLEVMRNSILIGNNSMDSICSDPPGGINFMHREWDSDLGGRLPWVAWMTTVMKECYRVLKPGGHMLIWAIPRTSHWTATAIEEAGFEVRDVITHHYGSGFPKSQDVGKFIDKLHGAEREVVGTSRSKGIRPGSNHIVGDDWGAQNHTLTAPATDDAKEWDDWGTALKPATEHWILARKPLSEKSVARNVLKHGTGALNVGACRVDRAADDVPGWHKSGANGSAGFQGEDTFKIREMSAEEIQERCGDKGRFPPNLLLSHDETCGFEDGECAPWCPVAEVDRQSKGSSRYFPTFKYLPKPSRSEKEAGLDNLPLKTLNRVNPGGLEHEPRFQPIQVKNNHNTVKGKKLMKWLIELITPPGGWVLDPFAGSGTTGVAALENGFSFFGIEKDPEHYEIAEARLNHVIAQQSGQLLLLTLEELDAYV